MTVGLLHRGLELAAERFGDRVALRAGDRDLGFQELDVLASSFARHLASAGVRTGDRVAVLLSNRPELVVAVHAVAKLGASSVLLSPAWRALELEHALALTSPVHAVADGDGAELLAGMLAGAVTDLDDDEVEARTRSLGTARQAGVDVDGDREAVLVFSSGTTGMPKAVRHTHLSIACATADWVTALGLTADDRFQVATPPSHILGLLNLLAAIAAGATVRLHRRFDLDEELHRVAAERMTLEMAVAPIALAMANHPDLERFDLSSLRYVMWGATPVTESVARTVTERTGVRWLAAYGASELPVIACNPVDRPDAWRLDSAGVPPAGVELRVADLDDGRTLPAGETGEIQGRSLSLMAGYLPEDANADAFVDGWYRTGDVGWLEPGTPAAGAPAGGGTTGPWVHLTDRCKEMMKVNGFQVAPAEVEAVLHGHPAVLDCAVFGVADERTGDAPVAAVRLDPAVPVAPGELERLVAGSLATYKHLRAVVVVDEIPRLPSGKVLRRTLRDSLAPQLVVAGDGR